MGKQVEEKLVLLCSESGEILQVIQKEGDWFIPDTLSGESFLITVSEFSLSNAMQFLQEVIQFGAVFNREFSCSHDNSIKQFSGIKMPDGIIITISRIQENMLKFLEEIMDINHILQQKIRSYQQTISAQTKAEPISLYEEISRINNELINTERKLHRTNKSLENKTEVLQLVNRVLRHDLMNIFSVLKSGLRIYAADQSPEILRTITKRMNDGIALIREMNALGNLDDKKKKLTPFSSEALVEMLEENFPDLKIELEGKAEIWADSFIHSVFINLASNAIRHGKANQINLKFQTNNAGTIVHFCDNGNGIPKEIWEKIFELNYVFGKSGNTGIGLYILKRVMERYNGKVEIQNLETDKTCFVLEFPKN